MKLKTWLQSRMMSQLASSKYLEKQRASVRKQDKKNNKPPTVHYFHQVDDPFSHLAVQKLDALKNTYHLNWQIHLVGQPEPAFQGDKDRYREWALRDARSIAAGFSTTFPTSECWPDEQQVLVANQRLAKVIDNSGFASEAIEVGEMLWAGTAALEGDRTSVSDLLAEGEALRAELGHYFGATFYFQGEWFWGVDRLHLLEDRLRNEGYAQSDSLVCPLPEVGTSPIDASAVTLEYFPSLRSPYTAVGHQRVLDVIERTQVKLKLKPVMPMMMRGVPNPLRKGRYIMMDSAREARHYGVPFGKITDPFGEPVKQAFSLFPGVAETGRGLDFVTAYLKAAWAERRDITKKSVLEGLLTEIGLDKDFDKYVTPGWMEVLEANVQEMLDDGLWGVPSFRVSGGEAPPFVCWGQDRIWLVEEDIRRRVAK